MGISKNVKFFILFQGCPEGWSKNPERSLCFMIVRQFADWYTARDKCGEENGQLAVFTSPQDQDFFKGQMSRIVRKPDFCLDENKGADQLRGHREADQRLCFRYTDSTIPLLLKSEISSF